MSATAIRQDQRRTEFTAATFPTPERLPTVAADGLIQALENYTRADRIARFTERACARVLLNQIEYFMPASEERNQLRRKILDALSAWRDSTLAQYKDEMERWEPSESPVAETDSKTALPR